MRFYFMANTSIYNIKRGTSGVYMITCIANNKKYIGSSVDIGARLSTHFGRDAKKYKHREFYRDILKFGRDGFKWEVLELCSKDNLIEREAYYYHIYKPEYNLIEPCECSFNNPLVRELSLNGSLNNGEKLRVLYSKPEYKALFRHIQEKRFKAVAMLKDDEVVKEFATLSDCAKWLNENTTFKGKNKVSTIKAVCDGERPTAYCYKFKYIQSVTTMAKASTQSIDTAVEAEGTSDDVKR